MDMASPPALPPSGPDVMASILPESDTPSASSEVSRNPPSPSKPNIDSRKPAPSSYQHSRSSTFDDVISTATAVPVTAVYPPRFSRPIKRKPVSSTASLLITTYLPQQQSSLAHTSTPSVDLPNKPDQRFARSPSIDSPTLYDYPDPLRFSLLASQLSDSNHIAPGDDGAVTGSSRNDSTDTGLSVTATAETELSDVLSEYDDLISDLTTVDATPDAASAQTGDECSDDNSDIESVYSDNSDHNPSPPMFASKPTPPHLRLEKVDNSVIEEGPRTHIDDSPQSSALAASPQLNKPLPRSPSLASPLASFFGWGNPSPSATEFSSIPSPLFPAKKEVSNDARKSTNGSFSESTKPDATTNPIEHYESYLSTPPPTSTSVSAALVDEMEEELKAISSELAASIRREIDLEDLVDRLQEQINNPQAPSKRTSDYYSDSGYSSAKLSDYDQSRDEIEKIQRKSEQEKASLRLELTTKVQDERDKRKELDRKIKELAEKASAVDSAQVNSVDASGRIKELENTCEELRRKLSEERDSKGNFEDLLSALKGELRDACNERDNLRDEVVPELRARVEGLETEAAEYANLTYESTKMHQELQSLKKENRSLRNSAAIQPEELPKRMSAGLTRSNSVATASFRGQRPPAFSLSRSDSVKQHIAQPDSREALLERLKDVEAQRDALHSALKSLLERQELQNRHHQKKVRLLENERQRLLSDSPRKGVFDRDLSILRSEISALRRRAEDALEQKWQVEKGLSGLKMDLDRAEEEIELLRSLLKEKDILIPPSFARYSGSSDTMREPVTSESLQIAYTELQNVYAESLDRIKQLEDAASDEQTKLAVARLERSLSAALLERDTARKEADEQRAQYDDLASNEVKHIAAEGALADELSESAQRIEQLASQVRQQLAVNAELRERLSAAVTRGETDRKANSDRIAELQERLRNLEDQVVSAQTASEERVGRHEEEMAKLREAHNEQLRRLQNSGIGGVKASQKSLLTLAMPMFDRASSAIGAKSFEEEAEMKTLRARVAELEKALAEAENEMQEVVAKMNMTQVEVLNLQEDREAAVRETRKLEQLLRQEHSKVFGGLFRSAGIRA